MCYAVLRKYDIFQINSANLVNVRGAQTFNANPLARHSAGAVEVGTLRHSQLMFPMFHQTRVGLVPLPWMHADCGSMQPPGTAFTPTPPHLLLMAIRLWASLMALSPAGLPKDQEPSGTRPFQGTGCISGSHTPRGRSVVFGVYICTLTLSLVCGALLWCCALRASWLR